MERCGAGAGPDPSAPAQLGPWSSNQLESKITNPLDTVVELIIEGSQAPRPPTVLSGTVLVPRNSQAASLSFSNPLVPVDCFSGLVQGPISPANPKLQVSEYTTEEKKFEAPSVELFPPVKGNSYRLAMVRSGLTFWPCASPAKAKRAAGKMYFFSMVKRLFGARYELIFLLAKC